jgi:hypothetical protein
MCLEKSEEELTYWEQVSSRHIRTHDSVIRVLDGMQIQIGSPNIDHAETI